MSTSNLPTPPTEAEVYDAYNSLFRLLSALCRGTTGPAALPFCDAAQAVSEVLTANNEVAIQANTAAFTALTPEMNKANDALSTLKTQIAGVASAIANVGKVEEAINKVLQITAKFI